VPGIGDELLLELKRQILASLTPHLSGVLLDPAAFQACGKSVSPGVGVMVKAEAGWTASTSRGDRSTCTNPAWTVARIAEAGAAGVKLMVYYRPDGDPGVVERQRECARAVGEQCAANHLAYTIEPIGYPLFADEHGHGPEVDAVRASRRSAIVIESARELSRPEYRGDLIKIDFPVDLRFVHPWSEGTYDGQRRDALYTADHVERACADLAEACQLPWVIMSSGASNAEFADYMRHASRHGCSGYICGAGIWKPLLEELPDMAAVRRRLDSEGVLNIERIDAAMEARVRPSGPTSRAISQGEPSCQERRRT